MKSRGLMQHDLAGHDTILTSALLSTHPKYPKHNQLRIESAGHSLSDYAPVLTIEPPHTFTIKRRKRSAKPAPQFPKHRWSN